MSIILAPKKAGQPKKSQQRRDEEKEQRKDMGDAVDDIGVAFKTDVADVGVAGQNVALRLIQLVQRLFGVQDLRLAVLQIPNGKVVIATPGAENLALLLKLCHQVQYLCAD